MYRMVPLVVLSLAIVQVCIAEQPQQKLKVAIYYEYYCPDSQGFLLRQFSSAYDDFKDMLDVTLVPFGKAESANNGREFYCQHGPAECTMNRVHSCALDLLKENQTAQVNFVLCHMSWTESIEQCANAVNISYEALKVCETGSRGIELQLKAERQTHRIARPYPAYIPTIVFNGTFSNRKQQLASSDFKKWVCHELYGLYGFSDTLQAKCS